MRKCIVVAILTIIFVAYGLHTSYVGAVSSNIVISQVELGTSLSASNEFIEIYNNSPTDIEITHWCLYYASGTSTQNGSRLVCFTPENDAIHLFLPAHSFAFAISTTLSTNAPSLGSDVKFSATLSATAGHVRLIDGASQTIDTIGWGTAVSSETQPATAAPNGKILQRKQLTVDTLQDTDNNSIDIELAQMRSSYSYGSIYELQDLCTNISGIQETLPAEYSVDISGNCFPPPEDMCMNIDGMQIEIPLGYALDDEGSCQADECRNIDGLQINIPEGMEHDSDGNCVEHDYCRNVMGIQPPIPEGYKSVGLELCFFDLLNIRINELLPNAVGTDDGHEFIELYNPNDDRIDLSFYQLKVGISSPKLYTFPVGIFLDPYSYAVFSNDDIGFTLVNSTSQVSIISVDDQLIDESPVYSDPQEGMSWGLIDNSWQYSNRPTPRSINIASFFESDDGEVSTLDVKPCAPNQYRNPETNRCRLLATVGSTLVACKDGQYRSEITNRCRSIASDAASLTPCNQDQERNPSTNRCRLIASSDSGLALCKEGQERNTETNRCRNVTANVPAAAFAVEPIKDAEGALLGWIAVGSVTLVALGYAIWEWHPELIRLIQRLGTFFHLRK